jgi:hypothetical protein
VAFTDATGTQVRATREGDDSTKVGDRLQIVYDPRNPTHARWDTSVDEAPREWIVAAVSLAMSFGLLIASLRAAHRRRGRSTPQPAVRL